MGPTLDGVAAHAGRPAGQLTRRDVARALLSVPAGEARRSLPELRRALTAAGNPHSAAFWQAAEDLLARVESGTATVGDVRGFLERTGSEPSVLLPGDVFVWPDEEERGPVAEELYDRLVAHLEEQVASGVIDPDALVAGDPDALETYHETQREWLYTPLPDGRTPIWAVSDENDEAFLAAWAEADAAAREQLAAILAEVGERPCPHDTLRAVCRRLRRDLPAGEWPHDLLVAAGGVDLEDLPGDDAELWLTLAEGSIACQDEPPGGPYDMEAYSAWYALGHPDWLGAVASLARAGAGAPADADALARYALASPDVDGSYADDDPASAIAFGFRTVELLWRVLGALDADGRLTPLGWWGVPEALLRAWDG